LESHTKIVAWLLGKTPIEFTTLKIEGK